MLGGVRPMDKERKLVNVQRSQRFLLLKSKPEACLVAS